MILLKIVGKRVEIEELCPEHEGMTIDAFCQIHQKLCCCICLAKHHRSCQLVGIIADMAVETGQTDVQNILASFSDLLKCIENMQLKNHTKIDDLNSKKQEISVSDEKAIQEIKKFIDDAFAIWIKRFEKVHADSVGNLEAASNELKQLSTTVLETKFLLQLMLEKESPKQL